MCPIQEGKGESGVPLEGRVWCASAFPKVESGVPPLEGRVWCALSRRGGGGGGGGGGLVCHLKEGRVWCALPSKCWISIILEVPLPNVSIVSTVHVFYWPGI